MAIEIVSFPIQNGGSFHSYVTNHQRVGFKSRLFGFEIRGFRAKFLCIPTIIVIYPPVAQIFRWNHQGISLYFHHQMVESPFCLMKSSGFLIFHPRSITIAGWNQVVSLFYKKKTSHHIPIILISYSPQFHINFSIFRLVPWVPVPADREAFQQLAKHEPPLHCESFEVHGCLGCLGARLGVELSWTQQKYQRSDSIREYPIVT